MMDVSYLKHPSEMAFDSFIGKVIEQTKQTRVGSEDYSLIEKTEDLTNNSNMKYPILNMQILKNYSYF